MKLKKKKLLELTRSEIQLLGFSEISTTIIGDHGLFVKKVEGGFYLTLGLTISRYYDSMFTGSFYLSKSMRFASVWGDIPMRSYKRVSSFLTEVERMELLQNEDVGENIKDAWWDAYDSKSINNFIKVVDITENRFLEQPGLIEEISFSKDVKKMVDNVSYVFKIIEEKGHNVFDYKYSPSKPIDNIPLEWFQAAEIVLNKENNKLSQHAVEMLASDAWFQSEFNLKI